MTQAIRTFITVASITVLIWFYADQASTLSDSLVVPLVLRPPARGDWTVADPNSTRVRVKATFAGPARSIRQLQDDVRDDRFSLVYVVEADPPSGPYRIELTSRLNALEEVRRMGLTITYVDPPELTLLVDRFETIEMPVVVQADSFKLVQTTVTPPTVKVRLPESQLRKVKKPEIIAPIEPLIRDQLRSGEFKPGQPIELNDVLLSPLAGVDQARFFTDRVSVTVLVEYRDQSKSLRSVYVRFDLSQDQWKKYDLEVKNNADLALEIKVKGPSDVIASLTPQDVRAYVEISTSDVIKTEGWLTRPVNFVMPPGVVLDQTAPQVQFRLVERRETTTG
jgi:hypothetical protein